MEAPIKGHILTTEEHDERAAESQAGLSEDWYIDFQDTRIRIVKSPRFPEAVRIYRRRRHEKRDRTQSYWVLALDTTKEFLTALHLAMNQWCR